MILHCDPLLSPPPRREEGSGRLDVGFRRSNGVDKLLQLVLFFLSLLHLGN